MPQPNRIGDFASKLDELVREATLAGAELIVESAKERVPVDPTAKHHLRDAIHTQVDEDGVWVVAGDREAWYGHMVEHGTTHSAPEPFLIPAVEENADKVVDLVRDAIRRAAL